MHAIVYAEKRCGSEPARGGAGKNSSQPLPLDVNVNLPLA